VFCMLRHGRAPSPPMPDRSAADFQQGLLRQYDYQIRLLKNVKYWYLLPPFLGLTLASAGIIGANRAAGRPVWPQLISMAIYAAVFAAVWWANEVYAVRKLRGERDRLLQEM